MANHIIYIKKRIETNKTNFYIWKVSINKNGTSFIQKQEITKNPKFLKWSEQVFCNYIMTQELLKFCEHIEPENSIIQRTI